MPRNLRLITYDDKAQCRDTVEPYFTERKAELLQQRIGDTQITFWKIPCPI